MSDMKCPFCGNDTSETIWEEANAETYCPHCDTTGDTKLWQELIRTRKALDVAVNGLKEMTWGCDSSDTEHLLKEIKTALEQKDVK